MVQGNPRGRAARPPRGPRRGTGGCHGEISMDTSTHAFADTHEATTYTMLQRVLQTYGTTHGLSLLAALTAAVLLLVGTCLQRCEAGGVEEGTLLRQTLAGLKQRVRTRPARVPLPLLAAPDDTEPQDPRVRHQTEALSRALATLLGEAAEAHQLSPEGRWRIARALVADLLCLWLPPGDLPEVVVDAVMDQLGRAVAAQLGRARGQPVPSQPGRFGAGTREA